MTGGGYYEAEKVGLDSFANKLTAKATAFKRELTPLQRQINQIVRVLLLVVVVFQILVWVRNTVGGVPFVESVRMSTVILALIPNGLVLSIALTYALGAIRLLGKDMLVQQFNAVESLSNVDVLCTDKTGTLTSGVIKLEETLALGAEQGRVAQLLGAFAASTTDANRTIEALREALPAQRLRARARGVLLVRRASGAGSPSRAARRRGTYVLGAPEMVAPALRAGPDWQAQADAWAARGLRVVLFAGRADPVAFSDGDRPPELPDGWRPSALVCFSDELRPGVKKTLDEFTEAGIEVKIISGDNPRTVTALATQAGIHAVRRQRRRRLLRGGVRRRRRRVRRSILRAGHGDGRRAPPEVVPSPASTSRACRPTSSPRSPSAPPSSAASRRSRSRTSSRRLRSRGRYVAMIGDGVNDVIALKQANVAVGMQGGSQAARGVADLILLNDTFAPLPFAFRRASASSTA